MPYVKILIVAPYFPPDPTGSSVFSNQQSDEFVRQGHKVLVLANAVPNPSNDDNIEVSAREQQVHPEVIRVHNFRINLGSVTWHYGIPVSLFGIVQRRIWRRVSEFDPDVILIHSTLFDLSLWALLYCVISRKKCVLVSHTALWHNHKLINSMMKLYGRFVVQPLVRASNSWVVCVDKWTFENAVSLFANKTRTTVIPVSVESGSMSGGDKSLIVDKYKLEGSPILLSLGHVIPLRNRVNLVRALPHLVATYPNLTVVIVGMVNDVEFLDLAEQIGVKRHVVTVGSVPHLEIRDFLAAADVEIHDVDGRGLGITSVEAMDAGVPIVAWINDQNYPHISLKSFGDCGFAEDAEPRTIAGLVLRLLQDEKFRSTAIETQHRIVAEVFSASGVTRQYVALFEAIGK